MGNVRQIKYYSISQYSGTTGQYYYNYFFDRRNIDAIYIPLGCQPHEFENTVDRLLADPLTRGISVSMPYKRRIVDYVSLNYGTHHDSVTEYGLCNTVLTDPCLTSYNCDLAGVIMVSENISTDSTISILGAGAMGKMFHQYLTAHKYSNVTVYSRGTDNWQDRNESADVIINCTALGTSRNNSPLVHIPKNTTMIIDLSIKPGVLHQQALVSGTAYVSGLEFYYHQFIDQFRCYTGITLEYEDVVESGLKR
jgi:shikimate 5-dehydrogenase